MEKKNKGEALAKLLSNKGFYILLALALAIVGVSGYVNLRREEMAKINQYDDMPIPVYQPEKEAATAISTPIQTEKPLPPPPPEKKASVVVFAQSEPQSLILPLQGEMTAEFSKDNLIYSKTMQDWRVHTGIDIRGDLGAPVKAASDGVVISVGNDEMKGFVVVLQHEDGLETIYANLQAGEVVKEGQAVKQGEVIGGVGATANFEIAEAPHLHFEVRKEGEYVNPFDFMK